MNQLSKFNEAVEMRNEQQFSEILSHDSELSKECVPLLCKELLSDWHELHEDIVFALQGLKDQRAVESIAKAIHIKFSHLIKWENYNEFARKCTWALADIGSVKAKGVLLELAQSNDGNISNFAQQRIENWEKELKRKGCN
jgi:hypothetical protein